MTSEGGTLPFPSVVVVGVGDELLFGETTDTNGSWLARGLTALGLDVLHRWVVGDVREEIQYAVRRAMESADVVLVTGGLGPTHDDVTRDAAAELMGRRLSMDPDLLEALETRFRARGYESLPENADAMALIPSGASILANSRGAAPGLVLEGEGGAVCILLPGVPREMRQIFREGVAAFLLDRFGNRLRPTRHRIIHTAGIPESALSQELAKHLPKDMGPVSLAFLPEVHGVRLRLSAVGASTGAEADMWLERVEEAMRPALEPFRYHAPTGELAEAVGEALLSRAKTLATAESCTGGLIAKRLTDLPGSSRYFLGGVVAYSNQAKMAILDLEERILTREGAVSLQVAEAMALGAAKAFGAGAGLGVTGIAGPGGGTEEKPVGTVCYAAALDGQVFSRRETFTGDREMVRERSAQATLFLLLRLLQDRLP